MGGVVAETLLWSGAGVQPLEQSQPGARLVSFAPDAFARVASTLVQQRPTIAPQPALELLVGGRTLALASDCRLPRFTVDGTWEAVPAHALTVGALLPVDRVIPAPASPISMPPVDPELSARLAEDALALLDGVYQQEKYFAEMAKRGERLHLFELSGFLLAEAVVLDDEVLLGTDAPPAYYRRLFDAIFQPQRADERQLATRLRRWLGRGLFPPALRAMPPWAFQLESQARAALLRGLWDAAARVTEDAVRLRLPSRALAVAVQALLGSLGVEAALVWPLEGGYELVVRNVRRFAEWIHSNVPAKAGILRAVYAREPRYPSDSSALLPLNKVRPLLERIRATHRLPRRTEERADPLEAARLPTLRLLATAFHEPALRHIVNQGLVLEPLSALRPLPDTPTIALFTAPPAPVIANGVVVMTA